jgi:hypothetical protein
MRDLPSQAVVAIPGAAAALVASDAAWSASPSYSVRPNGAVQQWRKDPPRKLSVGPGS